MATQLQELAATPIEMLRQMRRQPGAYSRALIAQTIAEKEAQERAAAPRSQFREDIGAAARGLAPIVRGAEEWLRMGRDEMGRRDALNKMRLSLPGSGPLSYFTAPAPQHQQSSAIRSYIDQNSDRLISDPAAFEAFVSDPAGFVTMQNRVLTPREKGQQLEPTVEANGASMPGAEPDAGPESIPAPFLPPLQMAGNAGEFTAMAQAAPPWLQPRQSPAGGAVGEGGTKAGGRPVIATAPVPPRNPALAAAVPPTTPATQAIAAGEELAAETVAPERTAVAGMSPELQKATQDYLKLIGDTGGESDERDRYLSLARAGFAMAASGSPYLLQAIGQGGTAGLDAYQQARARAAERRLQQARGTLEVARLGEDARRSAVAEAQRDAQLAEQRRSNRAQEAGQADTRGIQRDRLDIERGTAETQRIIANRPEAYVIGTDEEGRVLIGDRRNPESITTGPKVGGLGRGAQSVFSQKLAAFRAAGYSETEALELASGARRSTSADIIRAATAAAKAKASTILNPKEQQEVYQRTYEEVLGTLQSAPATAAPAAAATAPRAPAADPFGLFAQ